MALYLASPSPAPSIVLTSADRWLRRKLPAIRSPTDGLFFRRRNVHICAMRRSADYKPSLWQNKYIQSVTSVDVTERDAKRVDKLKEEVGCMISEETEVVDKLELIDALQQLGVAYHFKEEIKQELGYIFKKLDFICMEMNDNAYVIALLFRLLRGHGFLVSQDIFDRFKDEKGNFKSDYLSNQTKSLLSLYEASHLAVEGEDTLNEARDFTIRHLNDFLLNSSHDNHKLRDYVVRALEEPLQWRMERLHTRWFIDAYQKEEEMRPLLLEFAKLDFNVVQNMYKRELKDVSRWWSNLGLWEELPFSRDRLIENHLGTVGLAFKRKLSTFRLAQTKANSFITAIDDVYDVYGSLNELELFTKAVDRWDALDIEQLPEYMRVCFLALFNTTNDTAYEIMRDKGLNILPYLKRAWTDLCKAYLVEAKWYNKSYIPTMEEYLDNGWLTISGHVLLSYAYCLGPDVSQKDLHLFRDYSEIIQWSSMIFRLCNDLGTSKPEQQRGDVAKSIQCCMHHDGVTEAVAREHIRELICDYWKKLNGVRRNVDSSFDEYFAGVAVDMARTAHCFYQYGDGYGSPERETKDTVISLLIEPVQI